MEFIKPDFVVVGATYPNGRVKLLASKTLTEVELKENLQFPDIFDRRRVLLFDSKVDITLIAKLKDYIEVWGDSYPEAWHSLFSQWTPEGDRRELSITRELNQ